MLNQNMKFVVLVLFTMGFFLSGCSSQKVLPSSVEKSDSPWADFGSAKDAYDLIIPDYTSIEELKELGYDPYSMANVAILTYLDVIQRFMPNQAIRVSDLPSGVQRCIKAQDACYALEATPGVTEKSRYGNAALDVMNFRKRTELSGWNFDALIVVVDDVAVYKIWKGTPLSKKYDDKKNPLGPIQGIKDIIK